ncbi:nucleoside monophosphate kinase [Candidatus Woesearchaeota archaeon]|nr:nucleoside monophosphate kinase [Nanoarchaeota archaeon]MCB9370939.1 nucleoside monophosphate kinase [Candidatus Woesearchaeota archaeon]USN44041.1 MAG: nucleoside monophosphate kinase [Candidatus Woesearchaeota archaeon]
MGNKDLRLALIMLGAPGSGKGTQGEFLEKFTGFKRYVMSDIIKKELRPGNALYDRVFKQGILLGDSEIFDLFRRYFGSEQQVIIDGIPRTLDQAYWLYGYLIKHKYDIELVYLHVDEKKLVKRVTSRFYCPKCHTLYNTLSKKSQKEGFCDHDGEKLIQREDDTEKVFKERLKTFDEVRKVILDVYKGDVIEVDGDQDIEKVSQDIMKKIILR